MAALAGGLLAAPLAAEAQQPGKVWRVGVLLAFDSPNVEAFRQELRKLGYVEGRNLLIEYRSYEGKYDRLPALAAGLLNLKPGSDPRGGTASEFSSQSGDHHGAHCLRRRRRPGRSGARLKSRAPGGNLTGFATLVPEEFGAKEVQLLMEAVPAAARMAVLIRPESAMHRAFLPQTVAAAKKFNLRLQILEVQTPNELDSAFAAATRERADAMQVYGDFLFSAHRTQIVALAAKSRLPVLYLYKEDVVARGLMSYGPILSDMLRRAAEETLQEDGWPDGHDRQAGPRERLLAEPVLALLRAGGGVLDAHLRDGHLGHVDQGGYPDLPGDRRHDHGCLQIPGGHRHAEVDPPAAFDDPIDVDRFEQVSGHHLGASRPQGRRSFVLAVNHGANRKPAIEEQAGHGSPDRAELTGCPGDEDRSVIVHTTSLPFAELFASNALDLSRPDYDYTALAGRCWRLPVPDLPPMSHPSLRD